MLTKHRLEEIKDDCNRFTYPEDLSSDEVLELVNACLKMREALEFHVETCGHGFKHEDLLKELFGDTDTSAEPATREKE